MNAHSLELEEAFEDFYDNSAIDSRHCGRNIQLFLKYLKQKKVKFKKGFVVSLHDDNLLLNHFDARWGSPEKYENGEIYYRSNWYFHVFLVIDGIAFDFSQRGPKAMPLQGYLNEAYLPKSLTKNIYFLGKFDKSKAFKKYLNLEMRLYNLKDYIEKLSPASYEGTLIELFYFSNKKVLKSTKKKFEKFDLTYEKFEKNRDGSFSFFKPRVSYLGERFPLRAEPKKACRVLGFFGSFSSQMEYVNSDNVKMLKVYSNLKTENPLELSSEDIQISFSKELTNGAVSNQPLLHYLTKVTCTDLYSFLKYYYL